VGCGIIANNEGEEGILDAEAEWRAFGCGVRFLFFPFLTGFWKPVFFFAYMEGEKI
jgi:hypothetical protein